MIQRCVTPVASYRKQRSWICAHGIKQTTQPSVGSSSLQIIRSSIVYVSGHCLGCHVCPAGIVRTRKQQPPPHLLGDSRWNEVTSNRLCPVHSQLHLDPREKPNDRQLMPSSSRKKWRFVGVVPAVLMSWPCERGAHELSLLNCHMLQPNNGVSQHFDSY